MSAGRLLLPATIRYANDAFCHDHTTGGYQAAASYVAFLLTNITLKRNRNMDK